MKLGFGFLVISAGMKSLLSVACALAVVAGAPSAPEGRIVGGVETHISHVPYQLALEWNGHQFCAAIILSSRFALSAGHCVHGFEAEGLFIRTGSTERETGGTVIPVKELYLNPNYSRPRVDYDVAVIELESEIPFGLRAQPIHLTEEEPQPGERALVSGWGNVEEYGNASFQLQSLNVSITNRTVCVDSYKKIRRITERMFCAGAAGYDSCKGDSGGPIVLREVLVGIVSWGEGCGKEGYPGVYTNIANPEIREFIRNITGI